MEKRTKRSSQQNCICQSIYQSIYHSMYQSRRTSSGVNLQPGLPSNRLHHSLLYGVSAFCNADSASLTSCQRILVETSHDVIFLDKQLGKIFSLTPWTPLLGVDQGLSNPGNLSQNINLHSTSSSWSGKAKCKSFFISQSLICARSGGCGTAPHQHQEATFKGFNCHLSRASSFQG